MEIYVGLDMHSKETVFCIQDRAGGVLGEDRIATTAKGLADMIKRYKIPSGTRVALETGTQCHWAAEVLFQLGMEPVVVDAGEVRQKARRRGQKSDKRDAFEICDGLRRDQWTKIVWLPPTQIRKLREALSRRRHFVSACTREINSARFVLRSHGLTTTGIRLQNEQGWQRMIKLYPDHQEYLTMHFQMWKTASQTVEQLNRQVELALAPFAQVAELLQSCFGVGPIASASFIAAIGKPERFACSNQVISYLGLAPSTHDTGDRQCHGHITHAGPTWARSALVECAHQARRVKHCITPAFPATHLVRPL